MNLINLLDHQNIAEVEDDIHTRKIIVWGQDNLLARAIDQILTTRLAWDVTRMMNTDGECLLQTVDMIKPKVVVLCHVDVEDLALVFHLLGSQPEIRVITVGLENNVVNVYSHHNFILRGGSDFVSVVEGCNLSSIPSAGGEEEKISLLKK